MHIQSLTTACLQVLQFQDWVNFEKTHYFHSEGPTACNEALENFRGILG